MRYHTSGEEIVEFFFRRLSELPVCEWRVSLLLSGWSSCRDKRAELAFTAAYLAALDKLREHHLESAFTLIQRRIYALTAAIDWRVENEGEAVDGEAEIMGALAEWGALGLMVGEWLTPRQLVSLWFPWEAVTPIRSLSDGGVSRDPLYSPTNDGRRKSFPTERPDRLS